MSALPPKATAKADIGTLERAKGIEPSYAAWEAAVLPLNYARAGPTLAIPGIPPQDGSRHRFRVAQGCEKRKILQVAGIAAMTVWDAG